MINNRLVMRRVLPMLLVCAVLLLPAAAVAFTNEEDGFRDFPWGTELPAISGQLVPVPVTGGQYRIYTRKEEDLAFASARASRIEYWFWHDRLARVVLYAPDRTSGEELREAWFDRYGRVNGRPGADGTLYYWLGKTTHMIFRQYPDGSADVNLYSVSLDNEIAAADGRRAAAGTP